MSCGINKHSPHALLTPTMHAALDKAAVRAGIELSDLLWAAAKAVGEQIKQRWPHARVLVLCGKGINGADGYLCAELLRRQSYSVQLVSLYQDQDLKPQTYWAKQQWQGSCVPLSQLNLHDYDLVVDAVVGAGLSRSMEPALAALLQRISDTNLPVCAIDLPSGIDGNSAQWQEPVLRAQCTVTFERYKPAHVLEPASSYCGDIVLCPIGIPASAYDQLDVWAWRNHPTLWLSDFPWPVSTSHKFTRGHAVVLGGEQLTGASRLSARAAQRVGAGLVSVYAPASVWPVYAAALDSIMVGTIEHTVPDDPRIQAYLCGPGAGVSERTRSWVMQILSSDRAVVLDADALTAFEHSSEDLWHALSDTCVLTPHEGEFARLFGQFSALHKLERARAAARKSGAVVVLKGADTIIAAPDGRCIVNTNASPFLATAGSGDILAGLVTGLLAQGMPAFSAAAAAVWLHGAAGTRYGPGLIPDDILRELPNLLKQLYADSGLSEY